MPANALQGKKYPGAGSSPVEFKDPFCKEGKQVTIHASSPKMSTKSPGQQHAREAMKSLSTTEVGYNRLEAMCVRETRKRLEVCRVIHRKSYRIGIPEEFRNQVLFGSIAGRQRRANKGGSGLGLSIVSTRGTALGQHQSPTSHGLNAGGP